MPTDLDYSQVIQNVYDEPNNRLRVDTSAVVVAGAMQVAIDHDTDSIQIWGTDGSVDRFIKTDSAGRIILSPTTSLSTVDQGAPNTIANAWPIKLTDGTDTVNVNSDGSLNVVSSESELGLTSTVKNVFTEISSVAIGATVTLVTYTVPVAKTSFLVRIAVSGNNIATYEVYVNAVKFDQRRTYFGGSLSETFEYTASPKSGHKLIASDVITVKVNNFRPFLGDFEGRIEIIEAG